MGKLDVEIIPPKTYGQKPKVKLNGKKVPYLTQSSRWVFATKDVVIKISKISSMYGGQSRTEWEVYQKLPKHYRKYTAPVLKYGEIENYHYVVQKRVKKGRASTQKDADRMYKIMYNLQRRYRIEIADVCKWNIVVDKKGRAKLVDLGVAYI